MAACHDREVLREYRRANPNKRLVLDTFSSHHAIVVGQYAAGNGIRLVLSSRVLGAYLSKTRLNSNIVGYLTIYELVDVLNN
jgi:hypothetical protein